MKAGLPNPELLLRLRNADRLPDVPPSSIKRVPLAVAWRHMPWLTALVLAPLLLGSVRPAALAGLGLLLGLSVLLLSSELGANQTRVLPGWLGILLIAVLLLPILPLPYSATAALSPGRAGLAGAFPVEPGVSPHWLTLGISPSGAIHRVWELALLIAAFLCARHAAVSSRGRFAFAGAVALGLILVAGSDVVLRMTGGKKILGLWSVAGGNPAGTFVNRNHFADWVFLGAVFCAGLLWRRASPLRSARMEERWDAAPVGLTWTSTIAVTAGLVAGLACGSRGGALCLATGCAVWVALIARRSKRSRGALAVLAGFVLALIVVTAGAPVLERMASAKAHLEGQDAYAKTTIWADGWRIFQHMPVFGSGWGSFGIVHTYFKKGLADRTAWHAENDYLQLLAENGLVGAGVGLMTIVILLLVLGGHVWRNRLIEPELEFGALAALAAFLTHALIEFVFQITATALLASALLGFLIGCRDAARRGNVLRPIRRARLVFNWSAGLALIAVAAFQGVASWHWQQARLDPSPDAARQHLRESVQTWPFDSSRQIALARAEVNAIRLLPAEAQQQEALAIRAGLNRALAWDPLNWELRLERAWLDLAFSRDRARAGEEALEVMRLNPLNTEIPLRFARQLAATKDPLAIRILQAAQFTQPQDLRAALAGAWSLNASSADLWAVTPDSPNGLLALGDFALQKELFPMAAQAFMQISNRVDYAFLAKKLLEAKRSDLAVRLIPETTESLPARVVLADAHLQLKHFTLALKIAESISSDSPKKTEWLTPYPASGSVQYLRQQWDLKHDRTAATSLAEVTLQQPATARDLPLLRDLARQFPRERRLHWILYRTETDRGDFESAAITAVELAHLTLSPDTH